MRGKKIYVAIIIILLIYLGILYFAWGKDNVKEGQNATTMLVGDNTIWVYSDRKWLNITKETTIDKLNWQKFNIFVDNKSMGEKYVWHDDKWYLFDEKKNAVMFTGKLFAFKSNFDISIMDYKEEEIDDYKYINQVLVDNNLSKTSEFTVQTMTNLDIDNDGSDERFYVISNAFAIDFTPSMLFSIVFMVKNDKIYYIYNDISYNNANYNECKPYFNYFIDLNEDNVYEVVLSCGKYSVEEEVNMLYEFKNDEFKLLISNQ